MRILITGGSGFIGTNLCEELVKGGHELSNVDIVHPKNRTHERFWQKVDLLNKREIESAVREFRPDTVIHLAAETDTDPSKTMDDYKVNTEGTANLINAIKLVPGVQRFVLTSTQFVNQRAGGPVHDQDFAPHTVYGQSKIETEGFLRNAKPEFAWTIIRPTNIWGPWHLRYPLEFWKVLAEGRYMHPGRQAVMRSYGYVGNVVDQICKIIDLPVDRVNHKVLYVGDAAIDLYDWVNGFSLRQTGKRVTIVPRFVVFGLALAGDVLRLIGLKFPITSSRYKSMTTPNSVNMDNTFSLLGRPRYTLEEGIDITVRWLQEQHPQLVKQR